MKLVNKVKQQLLSRGFTKKQLLNNRGLIGATIDETTLMLVKNTDVRVSLFNEVYDKYIELDDPTKFISWLNRICG